MSYRTMDREASESIEEKVGMAIYDVTTLGDESTPHDDPDTNILYKQMLDCLERIMKKVDLPDPSELQESVGHIDEIIRENGG